MATAIVLRAGKVELNGELYDSAAGKAVAAVLPVRVKMARWGEEYYGGLAAELKVPAGGETREVMAVGELAYWPPGNALCVFFGPTPVSEGDEPRAASPVHPVGMVRGNVAGLKKLGGAVEVVVERL